jgi:hypothetical protein
MATEREGGMIRKTAVRGAVEVAKGSLPLEMEFIVSAEPFIELSHTVRSMETQKDLSMVGP